jgi:DNA (cytosine-5)-methyltransferase 1
MKIGSLFDGSGTAPLAAAMCGIEPVWASEIEPYPIKVTKKRFPGMKHLGSILDINGADVEPVDIICGGSPCQDLSVAGKQKGLIEGERSHLFFEMTRIIKEMRDATNGKYPRYVIWENVHGAFSSNNGYDFLAVLQAFAEIADPNVYVPRPACKGKTDRLAWQYAGTIMGDGYSIAWRTVDAQYWGVPQRRRRIYLVADLRGERADKILFEQESVPGHHEPCGTQRKEVAGNAGRCAEGSCDIVILNDQGGNIMNTSEGVTGTLRAQEHGHQPCVVMQYLLENHSQDARYKGPLDVSPMLPAQLGTGGNNTPFVIEKSQPVYCLQANGIDRSDTAGCNGAGWRENESYTLNTIDRHAIAYSIGNGQLNQISMPEQSNCLDCMHDKQSVLIKSETYQSNIGALCARDYKGVGSQYVDEGKVIAERSDGSRKYIVRRLTPLECCRLQGFPDWWTEGCENYPAHNVPKYVDPTGAVEGSDGAKCKMWGNGMALPNMLHVMQGIVRCNDA